jgi:hypothetical protein
MYFQFAWDLKFEMASLLPNTSCIGVTYNVVCIVALVDHITAESTHQDLFHLFDVS